MCDTAWPLVATGRPAGRLIEVVGKWQEHVPYFAQYRATFNAAFVDRSPAPYTVVRRRSSVALRELIMGR